MVSSAVTAIKAHKVIRSKEFSHYDDVHADDAGHRQNGILISNGQGKAVAFALFSMQNRDKPPFGK